MAQRYLYSIHAAISQLIQTQNNHTAEYSKT